MKNPSTPEQTKNADQGTEPPELKYEFYINAGPMNIWNLLVSPEGVSHLFYGSTLESSFEPGAELAYIGPGRSGARTVHIKGKVLEFEPGQVFSHTCEVGSAYGEDHLQFSSRVSYRLEERDTGSTKLTLVQDQWSPKAPSYENSKAGWWLILSSLKSLAESGQALPETRGAHE